MSVNLQAKLKELFNDVRNLPEIPEVAFKVSRLLDDPTTDAKALGDVIVLDPALLTQVLKLCNSAQYSLSRKVATISEAVALLGHKALRQIVYTIISHSILSRPIKGYGLEDGALWENSLTCGVYAQYLAKKLDYKDVELAFTASLLRDIGKIAMDTKLSTLRQSVQKIVDTQKCSFLAAEEQTVGLNHCELGASLANRWNFPEKLSLAIEFHHQPSLIPASASLEDKKLLAIIHLADTYTMMTGTGIGLDGLMYPLDSEIYAILDIPKDNTLEIWYAELLDMRSEVTAVIQTFKNN